MSPERRARTKAMAAAFAATLSLLATTWSAPAAQGAEAVVPIQGGWVATTSARLPVSFEVQGTNVLNAHFGFSWGFCGSYESHLPNTDPIDANGHWSFLDTRGQTIEATFVAPDRAEGTVDAVERQLPGCPHTHATFVAAPGTIPPYVSPLVYAVQNTITGDVAQRPHDIYLGKNLTFVLGALKWQSFGGPKAYATGKAEIRRSGKRWHPRASVRLSSLVEAGPYKRIYSVIRWVLHGPVPRGFVPYGIRVVR